MRLIPAALTPTTPSPLKRWCERFFLITGLALVTGCGGCACGSQAEPELAEAVTSEETGTEDLEEAPLDLGSELVTEPYVEVEPEPDFYEGHPQWCEWVTQNRCGKAREKNYETKRMEWVDYGACGSDHRGIQLRCVRPFWATKDEAKLCVSPFPKKSEQEWRRNRLRFIIGRFFGLEGEWWKTVSTNHDAVRAFRVYRFFRLIAGREASYRPWKAHNLGPDVAGADIAYAREKDDGTYKDNEHFTGYRLLAGPGSREGEFDFEYVENFATYKQAKDKETEVLAEHSLWTSVVQNNQDRWKSFGYAGQTTAGFVAEVDAMAPPEMLCLEAFSFGAYMNRIQRIRTKLPASFDCKDAKGERYTREKLKLGEQKRDKVRETRREATWHVLHRAASGGSYCPGESAKWLQTHKGFARRAKSHGLGPDQLVTAKMLGPKPTRELLMQITEEVNAEFCETFDGWGRKQETGSCY